MKLEIWIDNFRLLSIFVYFNTEVCCCRFFFLPNQAGSVLPVRRKRRKASSATNPLLRSLFHGRKLSMHMK
jgi:hypothetical protein